MCCLGIILLLLLGCGLVLLYVIINLVKSCCWGVWFCFVLFREVKVGGGSNSGGGVLLKSWYVVVVGFVYGLRICIVVLVGFCFGGWLLIDVVGFANEDVFVFKFSIGGVFDGFVVSVVERRF